MPEFDIVVLGGPERTYPTKDPRVRIAKYAPGHFRTQVRDDPDEDWYDTGEPFPTKLAAEAAVDDVLVYHFGEGLTRAQLEQRIERAMQIIRMHGATDGDHHKAWVIREIAQALTGGREGGNLPAGMAP